MSCPNKTIATFVSPDEYAHHINQVAAVTDETIRILRRNLSLRTPYKFEEVAIDDCVRIEYSSAISALKIGFGVLLLLLILAIFYYLNYYWSSFESGQTFRVGALVLAMGYGVRWAFMPRSHYLAFVMKDGKRYKWRSRSGEFKCNERAVANLLEFAKVRGLVNSSGSILPA